MADTKQTKLVETKKNEVPKAEELAKAQREISISEFFAKNRHLLGFDNPRKALLTTVKEGVDNSLTYDMPLVIRHKGKISIVSIGDFVDKQIERNKDKVNLMRNGGLEKLPLNENVEVLSFDKETLKLSFHKVSTAFRHKVNSKIFRVTLTSGRYVDLTAYHSVFTLNKGEITSIPTSEIGVGTPVVVPRNNWGCSYEVNELNLVEELLLLDHSLTSKINVYGINNILTDRVIKDIRILLPKGKQYRVGDFRRFNYLPINILRGLKVDINKFSDSKIGISMGAYKIPAVIKLDHNFAELLGFYVSEGSMLSSLRRLHFSFGSHETELVCYLKDLFEKVFKFSPKIKKAHKTAYNVIADSTVLCFVFKYVLNPGKLANTKRIPGLVFNFSKSLKHSFLLAYLTGDSYPSKKLFHILKNDSNLSDLSVDKVTAATASFDLYVGLQYLLSSLGINYSVRSINPQQSIVNHHKASFGKQFYIYIYTKGRNSPLNRLPQEGILALTTNSRIKYAISTGIQSNISFDVLNNGLASKTMMCYYGALSILNGDLGVLRVKSVEEIDYKYEWVYDVSVPGCENFVAGVGAIMCHNSLDAAEEASILPEIQVNIKQHSEDRFTVILEDNGPGIVKDNIPKVFAKLLYGSKFHAMKQGRGQQGIGISAASMYGQLTTGRPTKIISRISDKRPAYYYELHIDTRRNEPEIVKEEQVEWNKPHGTRVEIELEAKYLKGKQSVDDYLKQTAIVNPHASIVYFTPENEMIEFPRATDDLPKQPKSIKPHPYGVELGVLMKMMQDTKAHTLQSFLMQDFSRVSAKVAKDICDKAGLPENAKPTRIAREESEKLFKAINATKIMAPPTDCISPIGEDLMLKGLKKEINAEFYAAVTRPPSVYRGIPFQLECAIAYGGDIPQDDLVRVMRFANRVPLLYQQSACASVKSIINTAWKNYGLGQSRGALPQGPAIILMHIASVWVPFTSESKEAIAHYPEIIKEMKLALQECGRKLASHIRHTVKAREQQDKIDLFEKYIPEVASALHNLSGESKSVLVEGLNKILKKGLPDLESNGGKIEEDQG